MAIRFECKCGQRLVMLDRFAGRRVRCRQCGHEQTVPSSTSSPPEIPPIDFSAESERRAGDPDQVELPGLRTDADDEDEVEAPSFPLDPWYYYLFGFLGFASIGVGAAMLILGLQASGEGAGGAAGAFLVVGYSLAVVIAGAGMLLFVDVARNIRRLRLHADRNAGIRR